MEHVFWSMLSTMGREYPPSSVGSALDSFGIIDPVMLTVMFSSSLAY